MAEQSPGIAKYRDRNIHLFDSLFCHKFVIGGIMQKAGIPTYGIPTIYKNYKFRSRLEAKWAMFFDLLGWKYEYEPCDLKGWIPDFVLIGAKTNTLVEIKPFTKYEDFDVDKLKQSLIKTELESSEILLLGLRPLIELIIGEDIIAPHLGWILEPWTYDGNIKYIDSACVFNYYDKKWGFWSQYGSWVDRITGLHDGDHLLEIPNHDAIQSLWARAVNLSQWNA